LDFNLEFIIRIQESGRMATQLSSVRYSSPSTSLGFFQLLLLISLSGSRGERGEGVEVTTKVIDIAMPKVRPTQVREY
jgi:hypothetical protein